MSESPVGLGGPLRLDQLDAGEFPVLSVQIANVRLSVSAWPDGVCRLLFARPMLSPHTIPSSLWCSLSNTSLPSPSPPQICMRRPPRTIAELVQPIDIPEPIRPHLWMTGCAPPEADTDQVRRSRLMQSPALVPCFPAGRTISWRRG